MTDAKRKFSVIYISSSDDEVEEEKAYEIVEIDDDDGSEVDDSSGDHEEEEEDEEEYEAEEIDDDDESEGDYSSSDEEEKKREEEEYEVEEIDGDEDEEISGIAFDCNEDEDDDETLCERVSSFLREGKDLEALSVNDLKAYLRKHRIRLGGKKAVCIGRIREHWRISKGNAESLYPRSSFAINCTGDVCKGDVVLFRPKIKKKNGNVIGMRTVAGRVVKESYGSARQQHTFTIEVLWSKGAKKLPPLFPLLVKGRNLYRLKTYRQHWDNEAERIQVLDEKHRRGTAARAIRAMKRSKQNQPAKKRHLNEGRKDKKSPHNRRPSDLSKGKQAYEHKKNTSLQHRETNNHHQNASSSRQPNLRGNKRPNVGYSLNMRGPNQGHHNMEMDPSLTVPWQMGFHNLNSPSHFSGHSFSSGSITHQGFSYQNDFHRYQSNPNYHIDAERSFRQFYRAREPYGQSRRGYQRFYP